MLELFWKRPDGSHYRTIEAVRRAVEARGDSLAAATNAGIFEPGYLPTGLYVENGRALRAVNRSDGYGNFFLKPNGIFVLTRSGARVVATDELTSVDEPIRHATQSGPLLLRGGAVHPAFTDGSANCRLRSGVGVRPDGGVYLAISNGAVNFHDFATFFRDNLGTPDALYLDGAISQLYAPHLGRTHADAPFAGILAVIVER